jgi:penicillin-binding protein 1C
LDIIRRKIRELRRFLHIPKIPQWLEFILVGGVALIFLVLGVTIIWAVLAPIPTIENFQNREIAQSTKIYDRTGNIVLYDVHGTMRRTAVPLEQISPFVQSAAIAVEDHTFYTNRGFRPISFLRATLVNITTGSYSQGGSTITQQVIKNALLTKKKTILRKIEEIILSLRLTRIYPKEKILETYLNETAYGGTIYGVQEASQYFFGVDSKDVTLAQAAYLAALPQAPTYYSPYGNHKDDLDARKNLVLSQMKKYGFITDEQYADAMQEEVLFKKEAEAGIKAPHFVFFIREYLESKYGTDAVESGGLRVITTLDYDLQKKAEDVIAEYGPSMATNFNASNEGLVAVDPKTGHILTMVGSRGYFEKEIDGAVNITLAHRQPGSSFKPFVYASAFEKGYTPDTVVFDLQTQFSTHCKPEDIANTEPPCYSPQNFDEKFRGPVSLRNALAQSINVPAIKALYLTGINNALGMAERLGITTLGDRDQYGLTLVLGGGEVTLLELTSAYSVFANDGVRNPVTGILRIEDSNRNLLEEYEEQSVRALEPQTARLLNDVLSDNVARTPEFGADSPLNFPGYNVADKTGTTNDYRDVWIVGYTPGIAAGAWAGNNDNSPMQKKIAAYIIAPMWHEFMEYAIEKYPSDSFIPPAPETNPYSLPPVLSGNWNTDPTQGVHEILFWIDKDNPRGGKPLNPTSDVQFAYWDYPVQLWVGQATSSASGLGMFLNSINSSQFRILTPVAGVSLTPLSPVVFSSHIGDPQSVRRVVYYLNGAEIGSANQPPYVVSTVPVGRGSFMLRAVAEKNIGLNEEQTIMFAIQ